MANESKELSPKQLAITEFNAKVNGNYVQKQLQQALGKNAGAFTTSLVELYTSDSKLQSCNPSKVTMEAIRAAALNLPLNRQLGYAYITVFNNWNKETRRSEPTPTFIIGAKGYVQLAMRTGQYRVLNADVVLDGMLQHHDRLSGTIDLSGEPLSDRIIGYFAHFELINGFRKTLYMTLEEMANYALKYSPTFKRNQEKNPNPTVDQLCDKAQDQYSNGSSGQMGWEGCFNDMALKTVIRRLLSKYGILSIEMQQAIINETKVEDADAIEIRNEVNAEPKPKFDAAQYIEPEEQPAEEDQNPFNQ